MATATTGKTRCVICNKEKVTFKCGGCLEEFCYKHLGDHQQELHREFDEIEVNRDLIRQSLTEYSESSNHHLLLQQIDQWEQNSIEIIQHTAEEARQVLIKHIHETSQDLEIKLNKLTDQLRQTRQENDFNEVHLKQFHEELRQLNKELTDPSNILIQEDSTNFINNISISVFESIIFDSDLHQKNIEMQNGLTVAGGHGAGNAINQLFRPVGIYVDNDETIYVADNENHRIVEWKSNAINGKIVAGGNGQGNEANQLNGPVDVVVNKEGTHLIICDLGNRRVVLWPRENGTNGQTIISNIDCCRLTIDNDGYFYISDREKHEVKRWKINDIIGIVVAGGHGKGDRLNQLNNPTFVFVDEEHSVYVSDWGNHRIMKFRPGAIEGIVVAGGHGKGDSLIQLSNPQGIVVDDEGSVFIADFNNNRIMFWPKEATEGNLLVGSYGQGDQINQLNRPMGLSFNNQGDLYVVDQWNARVQKFSFNQS